MQKTVYYSKKFQALHADEGQQHGAVPVMVQPPARRTMKLGGVVLIACLALAVLMVALVPMVVGGAAPTASQGARAVGSAEAAAEHTYVNYASVKEGVEALELRAATPKTLPEGFSLTACNVVDGSILELSMTDGRATVLFRTAAGNDDLSWVDPEQYNYHASEAVGSITRSYMGASEDSIKAVVWAARGHSYAIVSDLGLDADVMRTLAESIA